MDGFCSCAIDKRALSLLQKAVVHAYSVGAKSQIVPPHFLICLGLSDVLILTEFCLTTQKLYRRALAQPGQCFSMHIMVLHCHTLL